MPLRSMNLTIAAGRISIDADPAEDSHNAEAGRTVNPRDSVTQLPYLVCTLIDAASETDGSTVEVAVTVSVCVFFLVSFCLFGVTETRIETAGSPLTNSGVR
jgi:hypothetical protein